MKKKILLASIIALSLALLVAVGGTVAWLFASTGDITNTFTPSNVAVELTETPRDYKMIPGATLTKDPTVKVTSDIDCYVFVEVEKINSPDAYLTYSIDTAVWTELLKTDENVTVYYREVAKDASSKEYPVILNNTVTVNWGVTKDMMNGLYKADGTPNEDVMPKLKFTAHVIQKDHTGSPAEAWAKLNSPTNP